MNKKFLLASLAFASALRLSAWDVPGHIIVAKIAYDNLNPHAKTKLESLSAKITFGTHKYNAVNIAAWADEVKHAKSSDTPFAGHFKNWHFIDLGLKESDPDLIANPPALTIANGTVVEALKLCEAVIREKKKSDLIPNEAVAVALICHLVGDLHQPLHCSASYYNPKPSKGKPHDAGGNAVPIDNFKDEYPELHQFWDEAYKMNYDDEKDVAKADADWNPFTITPTTQKLIDLEADILEEKPAVLIALTGDYYATWARETHQIGKEVAYASLGQAFANHEHITVDEQYEENAKKIARQQICLAGLRLAAVLNKLYP